MELDGLVHAPPAPVIPISRDSRNHLHNLSESSVDEPLGPIEKEMRATLARLKGTAYPDTFDWSVYDRISAKFENRPRGGVVFATTFKLVNHHSSCSKCHYAFEIDTYGRGCYHDCTYCYAKDKLERHGYWNRPQPFPVDLAKIRTVFYEVFETDKPNRWRSIMERRVPIRIGSMSDSFMWLDVRYGVTKEFLKILNFYKYPHIIFTRSDLIAHDDYIRLLNSQLCAVQFSIVGNNSALTRAIEPGAPSYKRRLKALEKLSHAGIWTTARINPLFPRYPDGFFTDPESISARFGGHAKVPRFELYNEHMVAELAETGTKSILGGFVRLSKNAISTMSKSTGIELKPFFKPELLQVRGEKRYSDREIAHYYKMFRQMCDKAGVRFSTCFIGNGLKDYFSYQDLWSNQQDCCDVRGNVSGFRTTSQSIPWEVRAEHASSVAESEASRDLESLAERQFAHGPSNHSPSHESQLT